MQSIAGITQSIHEIDDTTSHQSEINQRIHEAMDGVTVAVQEVFTLAGELNTGSQTVAQLAGQAAEKTILIAKSARQANSTGQDLEQNSQDIKLTSSIILQLEENVLAASQRIGEALLSIRKHVNSSGGLIEYVSQILLKELERSTQGYGANENQVSVDLEPFDIQAIKRANIQCVGRMVGGLTGKRILCREGPMSFREAAQLWMEHCKEIPEGGSLAKAKIQASYGEADKICAAMMQEASTENMVAGIGKLAELHHVMGELSHLLDQAYLDQPS